MAFLNYIRGTVFFADLCDSINSKSLKKQFVLNYYINRFEKIDSIENFDLFKKWVGLLLKHNYDIFACGCRYGQLEYYGYYNEILNYSGYKKRKYPILTEVEHGIRFGNTLWKYDDCNTCYICQGENRIDEIKKQKYNAPIIPIGPYIHYARQYYSDEMINEMKKKNGKTLLVFLGHTTEWEKEKNDNDIVNIIYKKYSARFNTIMVCAYWRDVFCDEIDRFSRKGAVIVSAGFRQDRLFVQRLKTIISLSDYVVANDIGTNIGYSLYLNKPFVLEGDCRVDTKDDYYTDNYKKFYDAFSPNSLIPNDERKELQKKLYNDFWGPNNLRTKEDMFFLFESFDKMLKFSHYNPYYLRTLLNAKNTDRFLNDFQKKELNKIFKTNIF